MEDFRVWKLIGEKDFDRLKSLFDGAKSTSILINGKKQYRKLISVSVEPSIIVSTNWY